MNKMKNEEAAEIGYGLLEWLAPYCRRGGGGGAGGGGLCGPGGQPVEVSLLEEALARGLPPHWQPGGKNGRKYKRFVHFRTWLACDLFLATAESWGGALAVRTGPAEFSTALMVRARRIGMQVSGGDYLHRHPAKVGPDGEAIPCEKGEHCVMIVPCYEEIEFFEALGVEWKEPEERSG